MLWSGVFLTWFGTALRLLGLAETSFWNDEFFTVFFAQQPLGRSLELMLADAVHAPAYFVLVRPFVHHGDFVARFPAVIPGILAIPCMIVTTRHLFRDPSLALWAGALVAVNPLHIWMSRMTRPYTLLFLVALLSGYYFLRLLRGDRTVFNWAIFLVLSALLYLTHYFGVWVALAQFLVLAVVLRNDAMFLRVWFGVQIIAGIPLLVWLFALSQQETLSFGIGWIPAPTLFDLLLTLGSLITGYYGAANAYLLPATVLALAGLGLALWHIVQHPLQNQTALYGIFLTLPSVIVVFVLALNFINAFVDRYFIVILPGLLWISLYAWRTTLRPQLFTVAMLIIIVSSMGYVVVTLIEGDAEREDWRSAIEQVALEYQEGDQLLINPAHGILPLRRYWPNDDIGALTVHVDNAAADDVLARSLRVWVLFKNPNTNVHNETVQADFDPYTETTALADWLQPRRSAVASVYEYRGITVLLLTSTAQE